MMIDHGNEAQQPDIVIIDKTKKQLKIMDVTIPGDVWVNKREIAKMRNIKCLKMRLQECQA